MVLAAELLNEPEIIFPEITALTVGAFMTERMPWNVTPARMLILMSASAFMGYALSVYVPFPLYIKVIFAFAVCIITLSAARSTMLPMISASVLPLLTNVQSLIYPVSVVILTSAIIAVRYLLEKYKLVEKNKYSYEKTEPKSDFIRKCWLIAGFAAISAIALGSGMTFIIAPPLAVVFAEAAYTDSPVHKAPFRFFLSVILCTFAGTICRLIFSDLFRLPMTVGVSAAVISALSLLLVFEKLFPPAAALAVLPFILSEENIAAYPFQVTTGAAIFICMDVIYRKAVLSGKPLQLLEKIIIFIKTVQLIPPMRNSDESESEISEKYEKFPMTVEVTEPENEQNKNVRRKI